MIETFELVTLGLGVGVIGGALGVGGGFIMVPVLFTVMGWPILSAVAASHFCGLAVSASASARYADARLIDWPLGIRLETAVVLGAVGGAIVAPRVPLPVIGVTYGLVALIAAVRMWLPERVFESGAVSVVAPGRSRWALLLLVFVGTAAAILGLGGGVLIVPILIGLLHVPLRRAVGTSVFMVGLTGATAGGIYYLQGAVPIFSTATLVVGVLLGAYLGSVLQHRLPVGLLRRIFTGLLLVLAGRVLWRILSGL